MIIAARLEHPAGPPERGEDMDQTEMDHLRATLTAALDNRSDSERFADVAYNELVAERVDVALLLLERLAAHDLPRTLLPQIEVTLHRPAHSFLFDVRTEGDTRGGMAAYLELASAEAIHRILRAGGRGFVTVIDDNSMRARRDRMRQAALTDNDPRS